VVSGEAQRAEAYGRLRAELDAGRQAYVVCPLIDEQESDGQPPDPAGAGQLRAAVAELERLRVGELRGYGLALMHGGMPQREKQSAMQAFAGGQAQVLVATTVIEVGIDVSNATIMIVQEADRFGLAQLHQLRGRVGRGAEQSYCLLISRDKVELTDVAQSRLQALVDTTDGFELAEVDLELRGEGQLLGTRQSGWSDLRFTKLRHDRDLIEQARSLAHELRDADGPWQDEADRMVGDADHRGVA
jgi:ATP-dependent DNA helicase RecG